MTLPVLLLIYTVFLALQDENKKSMINKALNNFVCIFFNSDIETEDLKKRYTSDISLKLSTLKFHFS